MSLDGYFYEDNIHGIYFAIVGMRVMGLRCPLVLFRVDTAPFIRGIFPTLLVDQ